MAAKFEIASSKPGQYRWVLLSQGRTLATSGTFRSRAQAEKAIASFRTAAASAALVDTTVPAAKKAAPRTARRATRTAKRK